MKIALVQTSRFTTDYNLLMEDLSMLVANPGLGGVDLVVFPEFFSRGFYPGFDRAETESGETLQWMMRESMRYGFAMAGSVPVWCADGSKRNRLYFVDGKEVSYYDKHHIFLGDESDFFTPGDRRVIVPFRGWNILLQLCYDLRFPVWSRVVEADYDMVLNVAQWPAKRVAVTSKLTAARAIENQCCYIFCNSAAVIDGEQEGGCSHIMRPDGNPVVPETEISLDCGKVMIFSVEKEEVTRPRDKFRVWRDADRFELLQDSPVQP